MSEMMMNASPSRRSDASALRDVVRRALRGAIEAEAAGRAAGRDVSLALREACDRARESRLHAEQLLVLLKEAWRQLPETRRLRSQGDEALARVVTACIGEYYRTKTPGG